MNLNRLIIGLIFATGALPVTNAADSRPLHTATPVANVKSNAVSHLRNEDAAFSLMIESYRQIQTLMIEADYDKRIDLAAKISDPKEREHLIALADQERDARLSKVQATVANFGSTYDTSRRDEERKTGSQVANAATPETASQQLRTFVPFEPKNLRMENHSSDLLPAGARMIYDDKRH